MKKYLLILFMLTFTNCPLSPPPIDNFSWQYVGSQKFATGVTGLGSSVRSGSTSLAIDHEGTPYIAYSDGSKENKATVLKYNGFEWVPVGSRGFSTYGTRLMNIAIDNEGTPYVAFRDKDSNNDTSSVMKYNSTTDKWEVVGAPEQFELISSLVIDNKGTPYVSTIEVKDGSYSQIAVYKYTDTAWGKVGIVDIFSDGSSAVDLVIDNKGVPYIIYRKKDSTRTIVVKKYSDGAWTDIGSFDTFLSSRDLATDPISGTLYITLREQQNTPYIVKKYKGGAIWENVNPSFASTQDEGFGKLQMVIDNMGTPYVAYSMFKNQDVDDPITMVKKHNDTTWENIGTLGWKFQTECGSSLVIDPKGIPYIAYEEYATGGISVMKYDVVK